MKKIFISLFLFAAIAAQAQDEGPRNEEEPKGFQREKLFIGGNFGLSFGDYTFINLSPQLGYRFNDFFAAGFGINGQYVSDRRRVGSTTVARFTRGIVGLNTFGRAYPFRFLMLQVQPEANYLFGKDRYYTGNMPGTYNFGAEIVPSLLLGGGAVLQQGRGALIISAMYDVLQKRNSPYGSRPVYNIGYNIGLY